MFISNWPTNNNFLEWKFHYEIHFQNSNDTYFQNNQWNASDVHVRNTHTHRKKWRKKMSPFVYLWKSLEKLNNSNKFFFLCLYEMKYHTVSNSIAMTNKYCVHLWIDYKYRYWIDRSKIIRKYLLNEWQTISVFFSMRN